MISNIEVKKLFGVFNHNIPINNENSITLILGQNGLGKTVILKLVKSLFDRSFSDLKEYAFESFIIDFEDRSKLIIERHVDKEITLNFAFHKPKLKKPKTFQYVSYDKKDLIRRQSRRIYERDFNDRRFSQRSLFESDFEVSNYIGRFLPADIDRVGPESWIDLRTRTLYETKDIINKYATHLPPHVLESVSNLTPDWLIELTESITIKLIETQRLLVQADEGKYRPSVSNYSNQLVETIKNKRSAATDLASNLDRTYPNRLINRISKSSNVTDSFLKNNIIDLQEKRGLLNSVGLLDTEEETIGPAKNLTFDNRLREVLHIYIEDSNEKLSVYDDLASRIKLLIDIINKRFIEKRLSIDKNRGFVFTSLINNKDIPLNGLSSGEQHELVLFFELLFNTESNSLLLIDEPEISLHISWQKQFIKDLTDVIKVNNLSVIIATHSPDIIGNHWNLAVKLQPKN